MTPEGAGPSGDGGLSQSSNHASDLCQIEGLGETVSFDHPKKHYYGSQKRVNAVGVGPFGPEIDFAGAHDRGCFSS